MGWGVQEKGIPSTEDRFKALRQKKKEGMGRTLPWVRGETTSSKVGILVMNYKVDVKKLGLMPSSPWLLGPYYKGGASREQGKLKTATASENRTFLTDVLVL